MTDNARQQRLFLIDGSNYIFRAFYAIRGLSNSKGFPTNAIYGFTNMLIKLRRDFQPDYLVVVFDLKGPTFRHDAFQAYKATRKPIPEALIPQIPVIKDLIRAFSIPILEKQGIEADDIIGTLARRYAAAGLKVVIVSGDKDMMQLVTDDIAMFDSMKDKTFDRAAVKERFGVEPEKVVEVLGLMGDISDNIPGVPGIGPKGATTLIQEYGSIEDVLNHLEKIRSANLRKALSESAAQARLSRQLAEIKRDLEIDFDLKTARVSEPDTARLIELFTEYEFSSLLQELKLKEESAGGNYYLILQDEEFRDLLDELRQTRQFAMDMVLTKGEAMVADVVGVSLSLKKDESFYIPFSHDYDGAPPQLAEIHVWEGLRHLLIDEEIRKHGHDVKTLSIVLARKGIMLRGVGCDTMVACYVLNPSQRSFDLTDILRDHLHRQIIPTREIVGSGAKAVPFAGVTVEQAMDYACRRTDGILSLAPVLAEKIRQGGFDNLFYDLEMPLISVLANMEMKGVLLDLKLFQRLSEETAQLLSFSEEKIYRLAGERFNINSPKQIQAVLFEKLGLPRGRKIKAGYSTDGDVLATLAKSHELPREILAYRSLAKLKSTYIDALPLLVNPETSRVHTSYNQTATATGRLSSSNPNLQNIPIRTLEGKRIRQAFIAPSGSVIISADYSQIELRVLAHLSGDKALIDAFSSGADIHSRTASDVFGVFPEMVNAEMRRQAKVINFGILYGMSAFGLAKELEVPQKLAHAYIEGYFRRYEGVRRYLDSILDKARKDGFVTTLFNRRRYLPELSSAIPAVRQFAERMAVNTPIQGTAAELIKLAMLRIADDLSERGFASAMIMQVHDELVLEAPEAEKEDVIALVKEKMEGVITFKVPLKVDIGAGKNWDEAHS